MLNKNRLKNQKGKHEERKQTEYFETRDKSPSRLYVEYPDMQGAVPEHWQKNVGTIYSRFNDGTGERYTIMFKLMNGEFVFYEDEVEPRHIIVIKKKHQEKYRDPENYEGNP